MVLSEAGEGQGRDGVGLVWTKHGRGMGRKAMEQGGGDGLRTGEDGRGRAGTVCFLPGDQQIILINECSSGLARCYLDCLPSAEREREREREREERRQSV